MKKFKELANDFILGIGNHHIGTYAAAAAFFTFVCIVPFFTTLLTIIPYTPITEENLLTAIVDIIPSGAVGFASSIIEELYSNNTGILSISIVIMLWSAAKEMVNIRNGLNDINDLQEKKNYLVVRTISTLYIALFLLAIVVMSFVNLFGQNLYNLLLSLGFPKVKLYLRIISFTEIISIAIFFLVSLISYAYLPIVNNKIKDVVPGAIFSSIGTWLFSKLFDFLTTTFINFSVYGSLSAIVVLLFYINIVFYIFFLGAWVNKFILNLRETQKDIL